MKLSKEIRTGIFVLMALSMLIYGINLLKGINIFEHKRTYYALYENIDGLVNSNPVIFNGHKVGLVRDIQLVEDSDGMKIQVMFIINNKELKITTDTRARIISSDLLGSKAIEIIPGNNDIDAEPESYLIGETADGLQDQINEQLAPLKQKTEDLIQSIEAVVTQIQDVIDDDDDDPSSAVGKLNRVLSNLEETSGNITRITSNKNIDNSINNINSITENFKTKEEQINTTLDNLSSISAKLNDSTIYKINHTMDKITAITEKIDKGEGSMGKLMNNDSLYNELTKASSSLDALLEDMKHNPKKYVHFSVFGKKQKGLQLTKPEEKKLKEILAE